jgi:hypothetical protein
VGFKFDFLGFHGLKFGLRRGEALVWHGGGLIFFFGWGGGKRRAQVWLSGE